MKFLRSSPVFPLFALCSFLACSGAPPPAETPPDAPSNLVATAGNASASLSWAPPASDGHSAVLWYTVRTLPQGPVQTVKAPATSGLVEGLKNGTAYSFTVEAVNAVGAGKASTPSSSVTPLGPPGAPTSVSATAGNAQATVNWQAPADNGGAAIESYAVSTTNGSLSKVVNAPAQSVVLTGLSNGTSYSFKVVARNSVGPGAASDPSNVVTPQAPLTVPDAPTNATALGGDGKATVSWQAPANNGGSAITGYTVTSNPDGKTASVDGSTLSADVTGLTNGTAYTFTVKASNALGTSADSAPSNAVTPNPTPDPPTNVKAWIGNARSVVSWTAPANTGGSAISGYTVTSSPDNVSVNVSGTTTTTPVSPLTNGTSYTFTVVATNAQGNSAPSQASNAVTPTTCMAAGATAPIQTGPNGCLLLDRDTSSCRASRESSGLSGFWLRFGCHITLSVSGSNVGISADGIPDYPNNYFPSVDACYQAYPGSTPNANFSQPQTFTLTVPMTPDTTATAMPQTGVGIALNGVPIFANTSSEGSGDIYEDAATLDRCGGHPRTGGTYHYHMEPLAMTQDDDRFVGVMRDGYPIYGRKDPNGSYPTLDAYGGHTGVTIDSPTTAVYHYHVNQQTSANTGTSGQMRWFITSGTFRGTPGSCTGSGC